MNTEVSAELEHVIRRSLEKVRELRYQHASDMRAELQVPEYALAHSGLARAYALQRDAAKARAAYQDFFALWKGADTDIPVLKEAKAEYGKLK